MEFIKITDGNRITIPKSIMKDLELEEGDYLRIEIKNKKGILTKGE